jgi:hypothetical protein
MSVQKAIAEHDGHKLVVARYGQGEETHNIALECEVCMAVIHDKDVSSSDQAERMINKYQREAGIK